MTFRETKIACTVLPNRRKNAREKSGVTPIEEKTVESHLRWFGCVKKKTNSSPMRTVYKMEDSSIVRATKYQNRL